MKDFIKLQFRKLARLISIEVNQQVAHHDEKNLLLQGALLSKQQTLMDSKNINDYEFSVFSQFGDDGIIQYLIKNIKIEHETFIEFGVSDFLESNTRFLMMNNNWSGFVMDGSSKAINALKKQSWFWKYDFTAIDAFIDEANINDLLHQANDKQLGLLHIDLDGNDYHILKVIDLKELNPSIMILEYNSVFGMDRAITVPYDASFVRGDAHYSHLYWGASLRALTILANQKGYRLVGCNLGGNNAYFVRKDLLNERVSELSLEKAFKTSKYRESRNQLGELSYLAGENRIKEIKGLKVLNVLSNLIEPL